MTVLFSKEIKYGGSVLKLETGQIAKQADGSVLVTYGDTVVLCVVMHEKKSAGYQGFAPLSVHFIIRSYAFGKIPYSFFKREGKPSEYEVLTGRAIDRSIRPLMPDGYCYETQVHCILLSYDKENDPDFAAAIGASAAMRLAGIPLKDTFACARVGLIDGEFVLNPTKSELKTSLLDMLVSSTKDVVVMIESEAAELSRDDILDATMFAHKNIIRAVDLVDSFVAESKQAKTWSLPIEDRNDDLIADISKVCGADVLRAISVFDKQSRQSALSAIESSVVQRLDTVQPEAIKRAFKELTCQIMRRKVFDESIRIDGRDVNSVRPISIRLGLLARPHGSSEFDRGSTQALVAVTMGSPQDEQIIDSLGEDTKSRFMLHYNFWAFSVGETASPRATSRRELGHGKLAWKAIRNILPDAKDFPYTLRVVSEITESDGSSSMATVCGTSLALMDAGVPIKAMVAGVALGILKEDNKFVVLTDILGDEDHLGEMDLKITGTRKGVTALQMDVKGGGLRDELAAVLDRGLEGLSHILGKMEEVISAPRSEFKSTVPVIMHVRINKNKTRDVIGASGKMVREICDTTGVKIDIDAEGLVSIMAPDKQAAQNAIAIINDITEGPQLGKTYSGTVAKAVSFGIFVNFCANRKGLVHSSEIQNMQKRTGEVYEYGEGDPILVRVAGIEDFNKYRLVIVDGADDSSSDDEADESRNEPSSDMTAATRPVRSRRRPEPVDYDDDSANRAAADDDFDDGADKIDMDENDFNSRVKSSDGLDGYSAGEGRRPPRGRSGPSGPSGGSSGRRYYGGGGRGGDRPSAPRSGTRPASGGGSSWGSRGGGRTSSSSSMDVGRGDAPSPRNDGGGSQPTPRKPRFF